MCLAKMPRCEVYIEASFFIKHRGLGELSVFFRDAKFTMKKSYANLTKQEE
jgi:hypothetical protein